MNATNQPMNSANAPTGNKEFDRILNSFQDKLTEYSFISENFYNKVQLFYKFNLETDVIKETELPDPDCLINDFAKILTTFDRLNKRNTEILRCLDTII